MPKIVDHDARRDEIAQIACGVVATHGFEHATVARIARAAGYTTGMVAHYYESKQDIILASLRLMLLRIEERLVGKHSGRSAPKLVDVLSEALPLDEQRFIESAFWLAFWGQVSADKKLKQLNAWVHREYMRLFSRCFAEAWAESQDWTQGTRDAVLRSTVIFMNGLTASAVTSPQDWPPARQTEQLALQLELWRRWAKKGR